MRRVEHNRNIYAHWHLLRKKNMHIFLFLLAKSPITLYSRSPSRSSRGPRSRKGPPGADMKHEDVWRALDTLAAEYGLSSSGLAKRSGMDPTTFNPSKRHMPDGRARWPSTESLAKVLDATGATLEAFTALVTGARALPAGVRANQATARRIPLIGFAQAGGDGFFDDGGYPVGGGGDGGGLE